MSPIRTPLVRVTVTIPPALLRSADRLARGQGLSRSAVLSEALRRLVGAAPAPPAGGASRPARVAEPAAPPYPCDASSDVAFASDAELLAEVRRRLASPARRLTATDILNVDRVRLADLCRRNHITRLSLFGSVLGEDFRPDSDVDVLVDFAEGRTPGFGIVAVQEELSSLFGGRRVDVVTRAGMGPRLREAILAAERVLYAA